MTQPQALLCGLLDLLLAPVAVKGPMAWVARTGQAQQCCAGVCPVAGGPAYRWNLDSQKRAGQAQVPGLLRAAAGQGVLSITHWALWAKHASSSLGSA